MPDVTTFQNPVHDLDEVEFGETQERSSKIFDADREKSPTVLVNTDASSGARADVARGASAFTHTDDEVDDLRFAFDSVRPAETPWIEVATLLTVLRALGAKLELNELLEAAQTAKEELQRKADAVAKEGKAAGLVHEVQDLSGRAAEVLHVDDAVDGVKKTMEVLHVNDAVDGVKKSMELLHVDDAFSLARGMVKKSRTLIKVELPFKSIFNKQNAADAPATAINFSTFYLMLSDSEFKTHLPDGDLVKAAHRVRILRSAFDLAVVHSDDQEDLLPFESLNVAIDTLHSGTLTDVHLKRIWRMMASDDIAQVTFIDFVRGMETALQDPVLSKKFGSFDHNFLLSMIVDTPVSKVEEKKIYRSFNPLERIAMDLVAGRLEDKVAGEWTVEAKKKAMQRANERQIHVLLPEQRHRLDQLHSQNIRQCFTVGIVSAVCTAVIENLLLWLFRTDGTANPYHCVPERVATSEACLNGVWDDKLNASKLVCGCVGATTGVDGTAIFLDPMTRDDDSGWADKWDEHPDWPHCNWKDMFGDYVQAGECEATHDLAVIRVFWAIMAVSITICVGSEIMLLYKFSIQNSIRVVHALDMHLKPLNPDRAFVGLSLVRCALELGGSNELLLGVDPLRDIQGLNPIVAAIMGLMYTGKIAITGFLIKVGLKRLAGRGGAKFMLPWAALPATAIWNALVAHTIMCEAKLRGLGVATSIELFQEIIYDLHTDLDHASDLVKMQIARAIGCNIACARNMYPAKEILLRHAMRELGLSREYIAEPSGDIDDVDLFIATLAELTADEMKVVLEILVLTTLLDGKVSKRERGLYLAAVEACRATEGGGEFFVHCERVKHLAQTYRNLEPLTKEAVQECLNDEPHVIPTSFYVDEYRHRCATCFAC